MQRTDFATLVVSFTLSAVFLSVPGPVMAQDAYRYVVYGSDGGFTWPGDGSDPRPEMEIPAGGDTLRVVQGPEYSYGMWGDQTPAVGSAERVFHETEPVHEGEGGLLLRGWQPAEVAEYHAFDVALTPGEVDREVAGRPAEHWELRATIERTSEADGSRQRYEYQAHFWVIPELRFSWAPFAFTSPGLHGLAPRLRDTIQTRLGSRGLIGRGIIDMEFTLLREGGDETGSQQRVAFQIARLEATDAPAPPAGPEVGYGAGPDIESLAEAVYHDRPGLRRVFLALLTPEQHEDFSGDIRGVCQR